MLVPGDHIACRFIKPSKKYWSTEHRRPKPKAFSGNVFSVWDKDKLRSLSATLADLQMDSLSGTGQAHHLTEDYYRFANEVVKESGVEFAIQVVFRIEDEYVQEAWRQWRDAHAQVEVTKQPPVFPFIFRHKLAKNCRIAIAPDGMVADDP